MDSKIEKFLKRHNVMSLATVDERGVWCANIFYVYSNGELIFFSAATTRHIRSALKNPNVAVSVTLESKLVARLQGVQIEGVVRPANLKVHRPLFLKKFPFAAIWNEDMWVVAITTAKYTDNTLGFSTKLYFPPVTDSDSI